MKNQKGFLQLIIILVVAAALVVMGYAVLNKNKLNKTPVAQATVPPQYQAQYNEGRQEAPSVKTKSDLDVAAKSLDDTDTTEINTMLNQLNSASSGF